MTPNDPLGLIAACLPDFGATELDRREGRIRISLPVPLSDGRQPVFILDVTLTGAAAKAREAVPTHLPSFCPDRHINPDGSFCLFWRAIDDIEIKEGDTARDWMETLVRFLQLQFRAARLRRWPDGRGRAHSFAVIHQHRAEAAAARLGDAIERCDFTIAVAQADDVLITREETHKVPRDNVHFEYGISIGRLGRDRSFLLVQADTKVKLASDLAGLTTLRYQGDEKDKMKRTIAKACDVARERIEFIGVRRDRRAC